VESGARPVVGVNVHTEDEGPPRIGQPDYGALERAQRVALSARRSARSDDAVRTTLAAVGDAARGSDNLMPPIIRAVKADCTLGEISDVLRRAWGSYDG